jgi:TIR domain
MSSLAEIPELVGFFSYSREDDDDSKGALSALRDRIQRELRGQLGRTRAEFRLWQDTVAIAHGTLWEEQIKAAIAQSVFFLPIITPTAVKSRHCKTEFELFLAREVELGRKDLIFPILYIRVPALENGDQRHQKEVLKIIHARQYADWTEIRHDLTAPDVGKQIARFCESIARALQRPWVSPEERRRVEEAEAQRVEDERRRQEEQAKRVAEEERRRRVEAEAQRVEDERRRQEEQAKRVAEEERRRKLSGVIGPAVAPTQEGVADKAGELRRPREPEPEKQRELRPQICEGERVDGWAGKPPENKRSRFAAVPQRKIAIGSLVALSVLGVVGFLIWKPPTSIGWFRSAPDLPRTAATRDTGAPPKIADRIPSTSPSADQGTLLAQKVVLFEEDPNERAGKRYVGSAVWRNESVPSLPGQPPGLGIRADIEIPERKISMRWSLRRNDDKTLPASHTVEVMFTLPPDFAHGGITNILGVLTKQSESTRGVPLAGLVVKVTNNFFLIGLSSVEGDRARNIQLLREGAWFDVPVVYNDSRRAIITIEKGTPGDRAFARAFQAWGQ